MKKRFVDVVELISYEDLIKIRKDIEEGGFFVRELVNDRIKSEESKADPECAVCSNPLSQDKSTYTIIFGAGNSRKKASFCALDCLEYFLKDLKESGNRQEMRKETA